MLIQPLWTLLLSSHRAVSDLLPGRESRDARATPRHWEAFRRAAGEKFGGYELGAETVISYHNPPFKLTLLPFA